MFSKVRLCYQTRIEKTQYAVIYCSTSYLTYWKYNIIIFNSSSQRLCLINMSRKGLRGRFYRLLCMTLSMMRFWEWHQCLLWHVKPISSSLRLKRKRTVYKKSDDHMPFIAVDSLVRRSDQSKQISVNKPFLLLLQSAMLSTKGAFIIYRKLGYGFSKTRFLLTRNRSLMLAYVSKYSWIKHTAYSLFNNSGQKK